MKKNKNTSPSFISHGQVALNRKARFNYHIENTLEAGIQLTGTEVKALRLGKANISDAYVSFKEQHLTLINLHIGHYPHAPIARQHHEKRPRTLLVHAREKNKLRAAITREGMTIIPLNIHFNRKGVAKIEIALAKGKQKVDKREDVKKRDWNRQQARLLKNSSS
jgi:SsrA-binding protein